jgi:flavin reductase (DIM6/NTAB) family NADH-FMN oxidoreductase RutF
MYYTISEGHQATGLRHNPLNALVAPRPIGWISTVDLAGRPNLAPFSYFNAISADPPFVMFAPNEKDSTGTEKDSLRNVRETGEFVVNIVPWRLREQMNLTSTVLAHGQNEFELAGLTPVPSQIVRVPRVLESPAALECRVYEIVPLPLVPGKRRSHVVIGEVLAVHIDDACVRDGRVDTLALEPMARLGGFEYIGVDKLVIIPRPPGAAS